MSLLPQGSRLLCRLRLVNGRINPDPDHRRVPGSECFCPPVDLCPQFLELTKTHFVRQPFAQQPHIMNFVREGCSERVGRADVSTRACSRDRNHRHGPRREPAGWRPAASDPIP